ncbi:Sodium/glucose cotransporter [Planctomycetes bacterium Poly30]|uniref:Sodium/glucose cotransporter n=1 Tax=Saltatorellus ferox TaxID=2528018 RepID=A0A518EMF7_9BACT|nr:Sodium/glucose cotransporter [Planctomycetes bacterium Poly30]
MTVLLAGILAYVALQLAVGVIASRTIANETDFFVAGRRLGPGLAAISVFATWFGAETCLGAAGSVSAEGLSILTVEPFGYGLCLIVTGVVFAAPLWRRGIVTLSDFFRTRFGGATEGLSALVLLPSSIFWAAAQIRAFSEILVSSSEGLSLQAALALAACIAIVYTVLGGLLADVWTDCIQASILVLGLLLVLGAVIHALGGPAAAWAALPGDRISFSLPERTGWFDVAEAWAIPIIGSVTAQEVLARSFAARSAPAARTAGIAGGLIYLVVGAIPVTVALLAPSLAPALEHSFGEGDAFLPSVAKEFLPAALYVLFAGALVSAILSTVDSALLVAGSLVARNVVRQGDTTERRKLLLARAGVVLCGLVAWRFAVTAESVLALIERASAFGSAGIVVAVSMGLATRRGGAASAIAAMVAGTGVWMVGERFPDLMRYPFLTSVAAAFVAFWSMALRFRKR